MNFDRNDQAQREGYRYRWGVDVDGMFAPAVPLAAPSTAGNQGSGGRTGADAGAAPAARIVRGDHIRRSRDAHRRRARGPREDERLSRSDRAPDAALYDRRERSARRLSDDALASRLDATGHSRPPLPHADRHPIPRR